MGDSVAAAGLVAEKRKLKKSLFRFDMIFFTICAIVAVDTIGQSSSYGAQAIFWLIVSGVTFLIPYGFITAELGAAFPTEGATYDWSASPTATSPERSSASSTGSATRSGSAAL